MATTPGHEDLTRSASVSALQRSDSLAADLEFSFPAGPGATARVRFGTAADGDLRVTRPADELDPLRASIVDLPWTWLRQVHGADVVDVGVPGAGAGAEADAAVTSVPGAALAVHTADCAPVALVSREGVVAAAHAGWRGVAAGVLASTLTLMAERGARQVRALVGPCIHVECYEFGPELDDLVARFGPAVEGVTRDGRCGLDLPAAVAAGLDEARREVGSGLVLDDVQVLDRCTACDPGYHSHRARGDAGRQSLVVYLDG